MGCVPSKQKVEPKLSMPDVGSVPPLPVLRKLDPFDEPTTTSTVGPTTTTTSTGMAPINTLATATSPSSSTATTTTAIHTAPPASSSSDGSLGTVFSRYAGTGSEIAEDRLEQFFGDVGISESETVVSLALAWRLNSKTLGEITKEEFITGFTKLGAKNEADIKSQVAKIRSDLTNNSIFTQFYSWLFDYLLEEEGKKTLLRETCLEWWPRILSRWVLVTQWMAYCNSKSGKQQVKAVSKDLWLQVWGFARDVKADLSNWEDLDNGAWPGAIDDFVTEVRSKQK